MDGGNPTSGVDPMEMVASGPYNGYPVGIQVPFLRVPRAYCRQPDPDYVFPIHDFGLHASPDGAIEYKSTKPFNGQLAGRLLICQYSVDQNVIAVDLSGPDGTVNGDPIELASGFPASPLDVIENPVTGDLYVSQLQAAQSIGYISLLRPAA